MVGRRALVGFLTVAVLVSLMPISCASGGGPVNLTHNPRANDTRPCWSSDGGRIIFVSSSALAPPYAEPTVNDCGIYVMDSNGANRSLLLPICPRSISWSPDSNRVAFSIDGGGLFTIDLEATGSVNVVPDPYIYIDSLSYSPDGSRILFAAGGEEPWHIYVVDTDGSEKTCLSPPDAEDGCPAWSPDGTKIAFESKREGNWEIYLMDADGGNPRRLTDNSASDVFPTWSPDGKRLAFVSKRAGEPEIYIMDADGGNVTRLTDNDISEVGPKWSPGGAKIVFYGNRGDSGGADDIYVVDVPGDQR